MSTKTFDPDNYKVKCDTSAEFQLFIDYINKITNRGYSGSKESINIGKYYGKRDGTIFVACYAGWSTALVEYTPKEICEILKLIPTGISSTDIARLGTSIGTVINQIDQKKNLIGIDFGKFTVSNKSLQSLKYDKLQSVTPKKNNRYSNLINFL